MGVGVWEPGNKVEAQAVDAALLARLVAFASLVGDAGTALGEALKDSRLEPWLMTLEADAWLLADTLATADIIRLIRCFTLLEAQISGWNAGRTSPVIPLVKLLRQRGEFDPALRKWIKANTDNRYLPYGSAL